MTVATTALKFGLLPLWIAQGLYVRARTPRLPEPPGERIGRQGQGPRLSLIILGDSSAAGVGAAHQDDGLLGQTVGRLAVDFDVHFQLLAETGATTRSLLARLEATTPTPCDVALISVGVNDITHAYTPTETLANMAAILALLQRSFGTRLIVLSGYPPVAEFPALPQPLRWFLGRLSVANDRAYERLANETPGCRYLHLGALQHTGQVARDGFHPGPAAYEVWGARAATLIRDACLEPARHAEV